ncbi:hypothetical protein PSN13_01417 [Micromonospora saelicesensis]|uniref:Uncharacterized protein n=1 Tax=Micromonospora saelicesensis TaxID=285676 RepID=A0A328NSU1_9ACTN|nr:hypothetical protein [Micromonospora saelicesensis]RAO37435.1 hypothetical protein PSN13_01417 [Micromonospora saelicesensis]
MRMLIEVANATIVGMEARPLTRRERTVLEALLAVDFQRVETLQRLATEVLVVDTCGCGCPSIMFQHGRGREMGIKVNASVRGSYNGLFLYVIEDLERGEVLGGIEWLDVGEADPDELPSPELLDIQTV